MKLKNFFANLKEYPSAIIGFSIILFLVGLSIFTMFYLPFDHAIELWKGSDNVWIENPRNAKPIWTNYFRKNKLPETIVVDSRDFHEARKINPLGGGLKEISISMPFEYGFNGFPKEINVIVEADYNEIGPHIDMYWKTPDGRTIPLGEQTSKSMTICRLSQSNTIKKRVKQLQPHVGLLAGPDFNTEQAFKGKYELVIEGFVFEEDSDFEARLVLYGQVHGFGGTDHLRRDLIVSLLWGTPIALAFSLLGAVGTSFSGLFFGAIGTWFGGWVDSLIQRLTELTMILPRLPIYIMVAMFISRSLWVILIPVILLSLFGGTKGYRAMFLQIKESHYIEAARAYGASDFRMIFRYMIPRIIPTLIPGFVTAVPGFVFLEAGLAILGIGDPLLPTWGKMVQEAQNNGALYMGHFYWVIEPSFMLILTALAFATFGFALDRIFNPRLRRL